MARGRKVLAISSLYRSSVLPTQFRVTCAAHQLAPQARGVRAGLATEESRR